MANTPTTPASVASRLTDEEIESIAESLEHDAENLYGDNTRSFMDDENNAAAVLRDYVRMRSLNGELRQCLKETSEIVCDNCETEDCETCTRNMRWSKLLAEAEKGEAK